MAYRESNGHVIEIQDGDRAEVCTQSLGAFFLVEISSRAKSKFLLRSQNMVVVSTHSSLWKAVFHL